MKKHFLILLVLLITFSLIGCSVKNDLTSNREETIKPSDEDSGENIETTSNTNVIDSSAAALDYFMPFSTTETQAAFYIEIVADNDIDYDFFNQSYDMTTQNMIENKLKYVDVWYKELEYSLENFLKLLNEEDRAKFEEIQANWEALLKAEYQFVGDIFIRNENYQISLGSIFPLEMAKEYLGKVRERALYIKYLQYCMETGAPNYPNEITVSFSYKSSIKTGNGS